MMAFSWSRSFQLKGGHPLNRHGEAPQQLAADEETSRWRAQAPRRFIADLGVRADQQFPSVTAELIHFANCLSAAEPTMCLTSRSFSQKFSNSSVSGSSRKLCINTTVFV